MTDISAKAAPASPSSGSLLLTLMKARTFIALIAVFALLLAGGADLPVDRQPDPDVEARGAERLPRHGHDLRHHHRRHRPVGRLDRRAVRHGRRLPGAQRHRPADRLYDLLQRRRDHADHARRRHPDRRGQRAADHPAQRRAVHRHARHALRRARLRAAVVGRPHLPEPRRQSRSRHDRLRLPRRGQPPRPAGRDLDPVVVALGAAYLAQLHAARPPHLRRRRQRARGAHLRRARQHGEDVRLHVLRLLRGDRRADHLLAS